MVAVSMVLERMVLSLTLLLTKKLALRIVLLMTPKATVELMMVVLNMIDELMWL